MKIPDKDDPEFNDPDAWGLRVTAGLIALSQIEEITERYTAAALLKQLVHAQCHNDDLEKRVKELEEKMQELKRGRMANGDADSAAAAASGADGESKSPEPKPQE